MILLFALLAAAPAAPRSAPAHTAADTRCNACHSTSAWRPVTFDHSKTGFPLEGRHLSASCRGCHRSNEFKEPVPTSCASCHDARDWGSRFDASAHQRTNFPLTGRHAAIPCEECHLEQRDRRFTRATLDCFSCHQTDYARTSGTSIDHVRAGFGTDCKSCHFTSRFKGALFPAHQACFQIDAGPHAGISCLGCHTTLATLAVTGTCGGSNFSCIQCHACSAVQNVHASVAGFQCKDRKCYECHSFTPATGMRAKSKGGVR